MSTSRTRTPGVAVRRSPRPRCRITGRKGQRTSCRSTQLLPHELERLLLQRTISRSPRRSPPATAHAQTDDARRSARWFTEATLASIQASACLGSPPGCRGVRAHANGTGVEIAPCPRMPKAWRRWPRGSPVGGGSIGRAMSTPVRVRAAVAAVMALASCGTGASTVPRTVTGHDALTVATAISLRPGDLDWRSLSAPGAHGGSWTGIVTRCTGTHASSPPLAVRFSWHENVVLRLLVWSVRA